MCGALAIGENADAMRPRAPVRLVLARDPARRSVPRTTQFRRCARIFGGMFRLWREARFYNS
jgi:hypothetical protein